MVFGSAARPPYGNPLVQKSLWAFWDTSGIANSNTEMLGFWANEDDWKPLVDTGVANVKATVYVVQGNGNSHNGRGKSSAFGHMVVAVASWEQVPTSVMLEFDWGAISAKLKGWPASHQHLSQVVVEQPFIALVQNASSFAVDEPIPIQPRRGMLLIVSLKVAQP